MTLTEQLEKGELPDGFYYFKMPDGAIEIASEYRLIRYNLTKDADKIEVLEPVPSFQEWMRTKYSLDDYKRLCDMRGRIIAKMEESNADAEKHLRLKNAQLKELLKEAKDIIEWYKADCGYKDTPTEAILTKIDNTIEEKK